jgi:hypothetical protein
MDAEIFELQPSVLELKPDACALVAALSDAVEQVNYKKTNCFKVFFGSFINSSFLLAAKLD